MHSNTLINFPVTVHMHSNRVIIILTLTKQTACKRPRYCSSELNEQCKHKAKNAHGAGGEENRPGNERITVAKACWLVDQCCRPLQLSPLYSLPFILCWRSSFEFPPLQSSVLSLSSGFLHFFFPVSAGFICKKMKAKTERDDELVRLVVLLRLPFLLVCAAAGAVGGVAAAALPPGVAAGTKE